VSQYGISQLEGKQGYDVCNNDALIRIGPMHLHDAKRDAPQS
jgi:hypothetical protein